MLSVTHSHKSARCFICCMMYDTFHSKCCTPEIHQIQKLKFLSTKLQHTATHCNILHHTTPHCTTLLISDIAKLQHVATHCNTQQRTAAHCNTMQCTTTHYNTLHHTAPHCTTLIFETFYQTAPHQIAVSSLPMEVWMLTRACGTLQHTATHCNTLRQLQHAVIQSLLSRWRHGCLHSRMTRCDTLQHTATHGNTLQHTVLSLSMTVCMRTRAYDTLQHASTQCDTLQHTATS